MKTETINVLKIELEGDEADKFKTAIKKINEENQKAGFTQIMNPDEKSVIKTINDKINS